MKKIYSIMALLAAAAGFVGCSNDNEIIEQTPQGKGKVTVFASTEGATTRTTLGDDYSVLWAEGDKINIGGQEFTLSDGSGTTTGTFEGIAPADGTCDVYYPSTYDGTNWPNTQTYAEGDISGAPMVATDVVVSGGNIPAISFTNVGAILHYTVMGNKALASINVKSNSPALDVTLDCGAGVQLTNEGVEFNIAVPAGEYSNATLTFTATDGTEASKTAATFNVAAGKAYKATISGLTFDAINGHKFVELAGYKWATENVSGAVSEGESTFTIAKTDLTYGDYYDYNNAIKAAQSWGSTWQLPTKEQWEALLSNCNWTWQSAYNFGGKTMPGYLVKDKSNASKYIFLPAAGYDDGDQDTECYYWSSSVKGMYPYHLYLQSTGGRPTMTVRTGQSYKGMSVRPVSQ